MIHPKFLLPGVSGLEWDKVDWLVNFPKLLLACYKVEAWNRGLGFLAGSRLGR